MLGLLGAGATNTRSPLAVPNVQALSQSGSMVSRALASRWRACHFRAVSMSFEEASPSGTLVFNSGEQATTMMPLQKKTSENETFISVPFLIKIFQIHNDRAEESR